MKRSLRKLSNLTKASFGFLRMMVRARDKVISISANGHTVLEGWEHCPEENIIREARTSDKPPVERYRTALFCYAGAHAGEIFLLGRSLERIAKDVDADLILTPSDLNSTEGFRVLINGVVNLMADPGAHFKLNGREEEKSELLDYDEVELMGNHFVVLALRAPHAHENEGEAMAFAQKGGSRV